MWFKLPGDERLGRCATEGCGGQPTERLEADGTGANYCSGCRAKIESVAPLKTCLDDTGLKITSELYKAVSALTGNPCLLAMIGSWGDTLDDADIMTGLHRYNEMGECFIPDISVKP